MLKILQARLRQYMNLEIPDVQAAFRKGRGTSDLIANIHWVIDHWTIENSRKASTSSLTTVDAFDCVGHNKLWKILQEMGIPEHLSCLLRKLYAGQDLYAGQEATFRNGLGTTDWPKIGKGVQGYIL